MSLINNRKKILYLTCINIFMISVIDFGIGMLYIPARDRQYYTQQILKENRHINRIQDSMYHHGLVPNTQLMYHWNNNADYPIYVNSLGLIDQSTKKIIPETTKHRILFLGDSFTEGVGFPYDQTFVGIISNALAQKSEVLNAGLQGYSPKLYFEKAKFLLEEQKIKINQAVIMLDLSDIHNEAYGYRDFTPAQHSDFATARNKHISQSITNRVVGFLVDHSFIINSVYTLTWHKHQLQTKEQNTLPYDADYQAWTYDMHQYETYGRDGLRLCSDYIAKLIALLRTHDIHDITLVVYPWPQQITHNDLESKHVAYWKEFADNQKMQFINLFPTFFAHQKNENLFIKDSHFNARGHTLVAQELLNSVFYK